MITNAHSYLRLSLDDVQRILGEAARPVPGDEYGQMNDLTSIENPQVFPGTLYLQNGSVVLVRIRREAMAAISPAELREIFGGEAVRLRSPAGKQAHLWVWADQGVASSVQGQTVHFLEVFPPCTQSEYEARIYREPPRFIR
jgi:hypothetical protein